jgi:CRISPR-associated protein Cmr4
MFDAAECAFLYLETSLRVGSGEETREVDQPVQREAATGYPLLPSSGLKGALRGRARTQQAPDERQRLLGSAPESDEKQPSCVVLSDALPLLFPVRSLAGLFAWATSAEAWARFGRDAAAFGVKLAKLPALPALPADSAGVAPGTPLLSGKGNLVLEELTFPVQQSAEVEAVGAWLAEHTFPAEPAFDFWRQRAARHVVVLPEAAYRYFLHHGTQVVPRIRIDPAKGTAAEGSLWTEEYLPPETLLYALVGVRWPEAQAGPAPPFKSPAEALGWVQGLAPGPLQLGSGLTLGHGLVRLRWTGKKPARASRKSKKA